MSRRPRTKVSAHVASIAPFPVYGRAEATLSLSFEETGTAADLGSLHLTLSLEGFVDNGANFQDFAALDPKIRDAARHLLAVATHRMRKPIL